MKEKKEIRRSWMDHAALKAAMALPGNGKNNKICAVLDREKNLLGYTAVQTDLVYGIGQIAFATLGWTAEWAPEPYSPPETPEQKKARIKAESVALLSTAAADKELSDEEFEKLTGFDGTVRQAILAKAAAASQQV